MSIRKLKFMSGKPYRIILMIFAINCVGACGGGAAVEVASSVKYSTSAVASRTTGIAPLSVFFDATATTSASTKLPFHELQYSWNFDDSAGSPLGGTTWSTTGAQSGVASCTPVTVPATPIGCRNNATSAVATHVYENTGTFKPTLTVYDGVTGDTVTYPMPQVVVSAFAGTTYCVAASTLPVAGSGGCPSGASVMTQSNFATAMSTALGAGAKQILFNRGDTFTTTAQTYLNATGPGIIGAYGVGAPPVISGVLPSTADYIALYNPDWRVMDLKFDGAGSVNQAAIALASTAIQFTLLRVTAINLMIGMNTSTDQTCVQDSSFLQSPAGTAGSTFGVYCANCTRLAVSGNVFNINQANSHNIRLDTGTKFVIQDNTMVGGTSSLEPFTVRANSSLGVIADNSLEVSAAQIKPQNSADTGYQHDIIIERNYFTGGYGMDLQGSYVTLRNNIFNTGGDAIHISWVATGAPEPSNIFIYNNTAYYGGTTNTGASFLVTYSPLNSGCLVTLENNLAYFPNIGATTLLNGNGACTITGAAGTYGNSSNSQMSTPPGWSNSSTTYSLVTDFKPIYGGYAYNGGYVLTPKLWTDFFGLPRTSPYDIGAVSH